MSRRRIPTIPRRAVPLARRTRLAAIAVGVVGLLAVAALIGGPGGEDADRSEVATGALPSSAADEGSASDGLALAEAPATTMATGGDDAALYAEGSAAESADRDAAGGTTATAGESVGAPVPTKIVRTGSMEVLVADGRFDEAVARLTTLATGAGGFVSASQTSALDDTPQGTVTLRVPADRFDDVLAQVRKVGDVEAVSTDSQDVTGEYADVQARLKALQAEREQINLVLGKAESIPDILSVRDRLSIVQGEIEQLQGRQQVLDDQTSLSTLTVSLHEEGDATVLTEPPAERTGFSKLWHDSTDRFTDGGRSIALGLASMAPWLLLALLLFLPARAIWRRTAPEADGSGPAPTASAGPPATSVD